MNKLQGDVLVVVSKIESLKAIHNLHVKGSEEQVKIWRALTRVPAGKLVSYGTLARETHNHPHEVGVAMGDNRVAMLIPCHRVIKSTGEFGQYHWGTKRKLAMIIREAGTSGLKRA